MMSIKKRGTVTSHATPITQKNQTKIDAKTIVITVVKNVCFLIVRKDGQKVAAHL